MSEEYRPSVTLPDTLVGRFLPEGAREQQYTEEEQANIEHVIALRFASIEDRPTFSHATGEPPHRFGLQILTDRAIAQGKPGRLVDALSERTDEFIDIVAKGDRVWIAFEVSGTHTAPLWGIPPTGKRVSFLEFGVYRLTDGKIAEAYYFGDELAVYEQVRGEVEI
ncbi:MAG: ester cyclase [Leucobacter sp.]